MSSQSSSSGIYPLQVTLRLTQSTRVGHQHGAMLAQLLKSAAAMARLDSVPGGAPAGVMPDAVETGRTVLEADQLFRFGLTLWGDSEAQCAQRFDRLIEAIGQIGLRRPARHGTSPSRAGRDAGSDTEFDTGPDAQVVAQELPRRYSTGLGGNFVVHQVQSLVDPACSRPVAIPSEWIETQIEVARKLPALTLRWLSPLNAQLPPRFGKQDRQVRDSRAGFFDTRRFPVPDLLRRLQLRLRDEFHIPIDTIEVTDSDVRLMAPPALDSLYWIKWTYGPRADAKSLFGVMGRIVLQVANPALYLPLILGQYAGVGEKTSFGLGRYVIEETQRSLPAGVPKYLRAVRGCSLVERALKSPIVDQEAERLGESAGRVHQLAAAMIGGNLTSFPVERFFLPGDTPRLLAVPSRADRALQRAVLELLDPVLDLFLSDSCLAYRRGLGRGTAAVRIQKAFREGWRWALKADFHRFFDSVDHRLLREKLEVYVQDDQMVELLMAWVVAGAPQSGRGLPTGAVISPLLANLFLEQFDEQVRDDGGLLVRYADDFVLLFRDPGKGRQVLERAGQLAEQLKLHLNDEKTKLVDLGTTPFDFLGYRFFCEKGWQYRGDGLKQVEDLGWHEAPRSREVVHHHSLQGELGMETSWSGIWIVGPQIDWIGIDGPDVVCRSALRGTEDRYQRRRISELVVLGTPTLDASLFRHRGDDPLKLLLADDGGRWTCALTDEPPLEICQLVRAQVALEGDPNRRRQCAAQLIAAKLRNHATLALAYPARRSSGKLVMKLMELAEQALLATDDQELLGLEGAGAAAWYGELEQRLDPRYAFARRVHPDADDPVNVMLNVVHTLMHRLITVILVREGFAPSLGLFHRDGERHAALASDLQEPFRHLMDRVVIELTHRIAPGEFHSTVPGQSRYLLRMESGTYRTIVAAVFRALATECVGPGQQSGRSYRRHIATMCRSLHRHLLNPEAPFKVFQH